MYDIKIAQTDYYARCKECLNTLNSRPKEIQFGVHVDALHNLYFVLTRKEWFDQLMTKIGDGLAIDIVHKKRYDCSLSTVPEGELVKGDLQRPYYLKELKQNMIPMGEGGVMIQVGLLPKEYWDQEVEYNVVFLKNKYFCHYNNFYDIKAYRWDLLDMGLFYDTLTYRNHQDTVLSEQESFILQRKLMRFEIPFERNKADYSAQDIRPLYDSLRLTDFNITTISIRAYSSIEGDEARNIQLQQERANSIVAAMQSFQSPSITTEIVATENWVDFLNDIAGTSHSYLAGKSKGDIKEILKDKKVAADLEPILQDHRKAIVVLELKKKDRYEDIPAEQLVEMFTASITEKNLEKAVEIQNSLFAKVRDHEAPVHLIDQLEIPKQREFSLLLNKRSLFKYLMDPAELYTAYKELLELRDLIPDDGNIRYNICALKFKVWLLGEQVIDPKTFKNEINELKRWGIASNLVTRMLINYEILMSEYHMRSGDFASKDKSLKYIHANYRYVPDSDVDLLSIAQYYSSYMKYDWAIDLLKEKVKDVNVSEDLLFYYLNLTLVDEELTAQPAYRTTMLNAYTKDQARYCQLFNPFGKGGITFQLLDNAFLRQSYCENCN